MENENSEIRTRISLRDRIRNRRLQPRVPVSSSVEKISGFELLVYGFIAKWTWVPIIVALDSGIILVSIIAGFFMFGGIGALTAVLMTQSPVLYYVLKEIHREDKMLPRSEAWEKNTQWKQNLTEYCDMINKSREEN